MNNPTNPAQRYHPPAQRVVAEGSLA